MVSAALAVSPVTLASALALVVSGIARGKLFVGVGMFSGGGSVGSGSIDRVGIRSISASVSISINIIVVPVASGLMTKVALAFIGGVSTNRRRKPGGAVAGTAVLRMQQS